MPTSGTLGVLCGVIVAAMIVFALPPVAQAVLSAVGGDEARAGRIYNVAYLAGMTLLAVFAAPLVVRFVATGPGPANATGALARLADPAVHEKIALGVSGFLALGGLALVLSTAFGRGPHA